jgi:hemerythrin-like metal-binding protein
MGRLTISVGAAQYQEGDTSEALFARADKWLYSAKRNGRNCVHIDPHHPNEIAATDIDRTQPGLQWSNAYECGNPVIDREHRELIALASALFESKLTPDAQPRELSSALDKLLDHVKTHFADEEEQLSSLNYHGLTWHKAAHAKLLGDSEKLKILVQSGRKTLGDLREFIVNEIITQHMFTADRAFFPLFRATCSAPVEKCVNPAEQAAVLPEHHRCQ